MKKRTITLSLLALATIAVGTVADIKPAMAQQSSRGARFDFEPNVWSPQIAQKRHYRNFNPPTTSVGHGAVPKAASFLGVDPSMLKPAPKPPAPVQPMVATSVRPQMSFGQPQATMVPKPLTATPFNPGFGAPQQSAPAVAQSLPPAAKPQQMAAPSSNKSLSGRMVPKRNTQSKQAVQGKMLKPKQPSGLNAKPSVASYGNNFFTPGSTKPESSGFTYSQELNGRIINHHK